MSFQLVHTYNFLLVKLTRVLCSGNRLQPLYTSCPFLCINTFDHPNTPGFIYIITIIRGFLHHILLCNKFMITRSFNWDQLCCIHSTFHCSILPCDINPCSTIDN
ncbi:hypothetical protein V6Z12_D04G198900 [Gossypium hirsutum]